MAKIEANLATCSICKKEFPTLAKANPLAFCQGCLWATLMKLMRSHPELRDEVGLF